MKTIVIGAGPAGALAAIYAAQRDHQVEVYELRKGKFRSSLCIHIGVPFVQYRFIFSFGLALAICEMAPTAH
jgi:flavin-dependent dehydrogenase